MAEDFWGGNPKLAAATAALAGQYRLSRGNSHDPPDPDDIGELRATAVWQGHAYVREVDGCWRDEYGRTLRRVERIVWRNADHDLPVTRIGEPEPDPDGRMYQKVRYGDEPPSYVPADELHAIGSGWQVEEPPPLWQPQRLSRWFNKDISEREWFMENWLPLGQCIGLYGIPGVRKSLWLLQALISGALGHHFCGLPVEPGPVLGLFCEDDDEEIARRADKILEHYLRSFGELVHCHCNSLVGVTMTDFVRFTRSGRIDTTPVFTHWREQLLDIRPRLATLDVGADFFGGNENDRGQVGSFLRLLDGTFHEAHCAGVFSAHPSRRGVAQGTLDSGSTGWEGGVRARLALHDPAVEEGDEDENLVARMLRVALTPSNERILTRAKSNYAIPGDEIPLVLKDDVFVPKNIVPGATPRTGPMRNKACDAKFRDLLDKVRADGRYVNDNKSTPRLYAPKVLARHEDHGDFTEKEFEKAMDRQLGKTIEYRDEKHAKKWHRTLAPKDAPPVP